MSRQHFISSLFQKRQSFLEGGDESLSDLWIFLGFVSEDEAERGPLGGRVSSQVVCEFCHWDKFRPLIRLSLAEHLEICFHFLIYSLGFSISLWVIGGG